MIESLLFKQPSRTDNLEDFLDINSLINPKAQEEIKIQIDPSDMTLNKSPVQDQMSPRAKQLRDQIFNKFSQPSKNLPQLQIESPSSKAHKDEFSELSAEQISKLQQLDNGSDAEVHDQDIDLVDNGSKDVESEEMLFDQ